MLKQPLLGKLNQGSIYTCARAERYVACTVFGIVLTARCDLAQDKHNVLNYAPMVPLDEWLKIDGYEIIIEKIAADIASRMDSALKVIGLPQSVLISQTPKSILDNYIRAPEADSKLKKQDAKFVDLTERLQQLAECRAGFGPASLQLFADYDSIVGSTIKELVHQKLSGYYFLPAVEVDALQTGFVVLLREVAHLPRRLAQLVAEGLEAAHHELAENTEWGVHLSFANSDFAMPIGELMSPHVEHLLQTFSFLFGRIGLPDPEKESVIALCSIRPSTTETSK